MSDPCVVTTWQSRSAFKINVHKFTTEAGWCSEKYVTDTPKLVLKPVLAPNSRRRQMIILVRCALQAVRSLALRIQAEISVFTNAPQALACRAP